LHGFGGEKRECDHGVAGSNIEFLEYLPPATLRSSHFLKKILQWLEKSTLVQLEGIYDVRTSEIEFAGSL